MLPCRAWPELVRLLSHPAGGGESSRGGEWSEPHELHATFQCFDVASCFRPAPMKVVSVVCRLSAQGLNARVFLFQLWGMPWGPVPYIVLDPTFSS